MEADCLFDEQYFKSVFENSPTSIQIYSLDGFLKSFNKAFETLFNVDARPFLGVYNILEDPQLIDSGIIDLVHRVIQGETIDELISHYDAAKMNGRDRWLRTFMFPVKNCHAEVIDFVIMHEDITELKNHEIYLEKIISERTMELERVNHELDMLSKIDPLTTLSNRRAFETAFETEYSQARRTGMPLSLILIDVDCFKGYNDRYGHRSGDLCLQRVATIIKECVHRASDLAARYGGDEFAILLPKTDSGEALLIAERMRKGLENLKIPNETAPTGRVTLSLGIKTLEPHHDVTKDGFFNEADGALYRAKNTGKNKSVLY